MFKLIGEGYKAGLARVAFIPPQRVVVMTQLYSLYMV